MPDERLNIAFTYDHGSGTFTAHLDNGAKFTVERQHISGKLENCLNLFKKQVIDMNSGKYVQKPKGDGTFEYVYDPAHVKRFSMRGTPQYELDLDLEDLEL